MEGKQAVLADEAEPQSFDYLVLDCALNLGRISCQVDDEAVLDLGLDTIA